MAFPHGFRRSARAGLLLVAVATLASACTGWFPGVTSTPKLYFKDFTTRIRGEQYAGASDAANLSSGLVTLKQFGVIGVIMTPKFIYTIEPLPILQTTDALSTSSADTVAEPTVDDKGDLTTEQVLRNPLFMLNRVVLTYEVPGFDIAPVTLEQNLPIKSATFVPKPFPIVTQSALMKALTSGDTKYATINGKVTITFELTDSNPVAVEKNFKVSRTLPFIYTNQSVLLSNTADSKPGWGGATTGPAAGSFAATTAPTTPAPSPAASAAASAIPSATPSATGTP